MTEIRERRQVRCMTDNSISYKLGTGIDLALTDTITYEKRLDLDS